MSGLFGNLLASGESALQNSLFGSSSPPNVPPGPSIVATSPAAAATVPGIVPPPPPGVAPPPGMVPVYAPVKGGIMGEWHKLSTPMKIGVGAIAAFGVYKLVLEDRF